MITILEKTEEINKQLAKYKDKGLINDYKIFIKLTINIEVYIKTENQQNLQDIIHQYKDYYIDFHFFTTEEINDYEAVQNIFETEETVNYGLKYRLHSLLDIDNVINLRKETTAFKEKNKIAPIITFYSYKGGMGRTTTMTAYALHLALSKGKKVVVMDFDLEAPGYLNFFNIGKSDKFIKQQKRGVIEYLIDRQFVKNNANLKLSNYYLDINPKPSKNQKNNTYFLSTGQGDVYIFPAGNLVGKNKEHFLEGLARLDLTREEKITESFKVLFSNIQQELNPDIILIDSRTGFNDIYGNFALIMTDIVVGFFGSSEQTKPGLDFLLEKVYQINCNDNLDILIVNSILNPEEKNDFLNPITFYVENEAYEFAKKENIEKPLILPLERLNLLEKQGLINSNGKEFETTEDILIRLVSEEKFSDLEDIFKTLNNFDKIASLLRSEDNPENKGIAELRLEILKNFSNDLPSLYAEEGKINPKNFFYRASMEQLFEKEKFIIRGFKGTGKTYLYKALKSTELTEIQEELKKRAKQTNKNFKFIDIISEKGKATDKLFDFSSLRMSEINDVDYYFKYFWLVYTWTSIMLDSEKINYKTTVSEELSKYIRNIDPNSIETKERFDKIIYSTSYLSQIEKDLLNLDSFLYSKNINILVMYDQLDNLVKPEDWKVQVSPLINYWWTNLNSFKKLLPKVFIRTDLFEKISGTNTRRLNNNLIEIEWSRDEVYAYFFKLIFANEDSKKAFIGIINQAIETKNGYHYYNYIKKNVSTFQEIHKIIEQSESQNQIPLQSRLLRLLMTIFFGDEVKFKKPQGHPYEWFYKNLVNADQKSISLRPFINLMNNAVNDAILKKDTLPIIHQSYYTNFKNRDLAVEEHFEDLVREDYNQDLGKVFDYIRENDMYKRIFLTKNELNKFLQEIIKHYDKDLESQNDRELKGLLEANGIIHRNPTQKGDIYYFPQLYKYWLGLKSRRFSDL